MRILIIKTSSMGDIVHTLPAITDLLKYFNKNKPEQSIIIDWVIEEAFIDILEYYKKNNKYLNHNIKFNIIKISLRRWRYELLKNFKTTIKELYNFVQLLRSYKYDYIIDPQGLAKSAVISLLAKKNKSALRHGLDKYSSRGKYINVFYNKVYNISIDMHAIERTRQLFSLIFDYDYNQFNNRAEQINYGIRSIEHTDEKDFEPYLVFLHCTTWSSKKYPTIYWGELCKLAIDHGYKVKLNSGNARELVESNAIANFDSNYSAHIDAMQPQSIYDLINIINKSSGVICVDTGLGHIAAALGKPGIGIYGSTNPILTAIIGSNFENLNSDFFCSPCLLKNCNKLDGDIPPCYKQLSPKSIWQVFLRLSN